MKKKDVIIILSAISVIALISFIISQELQLYTPIDKDETSIVQPVAQEKLNAAARFQYWRKMSKGVKKLKSQEVLKQGVLKVINLETSPFEKESRRVICAETHCESATNDIHGNLAGAKAAKFDLNDDKKFEVIGYSYSYCNSNGCELYILEKEINEYKDISWTGPIDIKSPITILNHKTNGYHDIVVFDLKDPNKPKLKRYGMDSKNGDYNEDLGVTKEEWMFFTRKAND